MVEPVFSTTELDRNGQPTTDHWIRRDTGEIHEWPHQFGAGAMWYCPWLEELADCRYTNFEGTESRPKPYHRGPDGRILSVQTPDGTWIIDSRCSNCGKPQDDEHHCWVRHGTPPLVTVDKNGNTCSAGGGSIICGNYHGFLRNGFLEQC